MQFVENRDVLIESGLWGDSLRDVASPYWATLFMHALAMQVMVLEALSWGC